MGAQIIKRKAGKMPEITTVGEGGSHQISYNSDGHIVIRYIYSQNDDTLIALDGFTSGLLKRFIHESLTYNNRPQRVDNGIPF
ncbi:hypothetical protein D2962_08325 [Biomaibacter acetigenes]|uniref:Uncharacterized protein n=1 Tax=Biomaibacter acetigenes TaxID=2316383 RepID=A0A3G2R5G6_9FIRM|nr:hypothetical protein [Biomaibacter acetigenes]AYO30629.1 hypothetical protein D2962_08325 [Biomaibacter acetigenes]